MTVYKISTDKIKIRLTDKEVISYFGAYDKITALNPNTKAAMSIIIQNSISEAGFSSDDRLLVEIRAKADYGCEITVSAAKRSQKRTENRIWRHMFEFGNTSDLILGILRLYRKFSIKESLLYKMSGTYRLIIICRKYTDFFFMNEFCIKQTASPYELAYTEEYGKLLTDKNAVEKIGIAFSKSF